MMVMPAFTTGRDHFFTLSRHRLRGLSFPAALFVLSIVPPPSRFSGLRVDYSVTSDRRQSQKGGRKCPGGEMHYCLGAGGAGGQGTRAAVPLNVEIRGK